MAYEPRFLLHCTTDSASKSRFFRSSCHETEKGNKITEMEETSFHVLIVLWHVCVDVGKHPQNQNGIGVRIRTIIQVVKHASFGVSPRLLGGER